MLALERGEVEGRGSNPWSEWKASKPDWVREGKIIPLMQMSLFKHPDLPDVPLMIDLAPERTVKSIFELVSITGEIGRPFVTSPGVPAERVAALRAAFKKMVRIRSFWPTPRNPTSTSIRFMRRRWSNSSGACWIRRKARSTFSSRH